MNILTDAAYWILRETLWSPFHKRYDVQVSGREHLENLEEWKQTEGITSKGTILASNHISFLDHFTIVAGLGEKSFIHFFARDFRKIKKGIWRSFITHFIKALAK